MKNLLVAQSGGPTSAINATLAGVIENALSSPSVDKIYGSVNGIQGVLNENLIDLKTKITMYQNWTFFVRPLLLHLAPAV